MQREINESSDDEMDRRYQVITPATNQTIQQTPLHSQPQQQDQQQSHQQQSQQIKQPGSVPFGIYTPLQQQTSASISLTPSMLQQSSISSTVPAVTPARYVVEEATTTLKVLMLHPRPALLKVIHLSGGAGEAFTMGEIINHVKEYIRERILYDEQDPRTVHCAGDLLSTALGVDTFTVQEAIGLFRKNCTLVPDSCIRIHRHLVTRADNHQQQTTTTVNSQQQTATSTSTTEHTVAASSTPSVHLLSASKQGITDLDSTSNTKATRTQPTSTQNRLETFQAHSLPASTSSSSSMPSSSSSTSNVINFKAAHSYVTVTDSDLEKSPREQNASSTDSSDEGGTRDRCRRQRRHRAPGKSNVQRQARSTSINVTYDEPDGAAGPYTCQVMMETSAAEEIHEPENDTMVVEFDSDAFSVEYDVQSDSEIDVPKGTDHNCLESDDSSSRSAAAYLVVCKESDVEYLADYSDSDNGSNSEISEADKWQCEQCLKTNPPFQRNCAGCWSVRPDWLPSTSKDTEGGAVNDAQSADTTVLSSSDRLDSFQSQSQETSKDSVKSIQDQICDDPNLNKPKIQEEQTVNLVDRKRKCSSSLSTSDSQEDKMKDSLGRDISEKSKTIEGKKLVNAMISKDDPCVVCLTRRKTASIIHGKTGHQVCCYRCARRLKEQRKSCPICRRPIQKVIRNFHL